MKIEFDNRVLKFGLNRRSMIKGSSLRIDRNRLKSSRSFKEWKRRGS